MPRGVKKLKVEAKPRDPEVEEPVPPSDRLFVQRGYGVRPRTGGGRIPLMFAVVGASLEGARRAVEARSVEVRAHRGYQYEQMGEVEDWGEVRLPRGVWFWIGHGVSSWSIPMVCVRVEEAVKADQLASR